MDDKLSRRTVIQSSLALGAFTALGVACSKAAAPLTCMDTSGISPTDVAVRASAAYVDTSTEPGKACSSCQFFIANASADACGTCKVVKGPVHPKGYRKLYAAKPT